jgi:hypothetical protein
LRATSFPEEIPPIVTHAILATEDKNFFSHGGIDYSTIPRVLSKIRIRKIVRDSFQVETENGLVASPVPGMVPHAHVP